MFLFCSNGLMNGLVYYILAGVLVAIFLFVGGYFLFDRISETREKVKRKQYEVPEDRYYIPKGQMKQRKFKGVSRGKYTVNQSLITECERKYFEVIKRIVDNKYLVQPQVNLASIITKQNGGLWQNELYRNIDFCIFSKDKYSPLLLIEINDRTHEFSSRRERDSKVKQICSEAGLPLISFWVKFGIDKEYIERQISKYIEL